MRHMSMVCRGSWLASVCLGASLLWCGPAWGQSQDSGLGAIKRDFNAAMGQPLAKRVAELEDLDARLGQMLDDGDLTGEAKARGLYYRYHTERHLAKFPDAYVNYAKRLTALREAGKSAESHSVFLRDLSKWRDKRSWVHEAEICRQVLKEAGEADDELEAVALYHLAEAQYHTPGMLESVVPLCEQLISEHPKSDWRAKGMRLLANTQFGLGKEDEALGTLKLLEQQYPDTKLAQYADMRRAVIWEVGRGEAQKALEIYRGTLEKYPDHMYGPYVHGQIARLQKVIEKQLIDDALDEIGRKKEQGPEGEARRETPGAPGVPGAHQHNPVVKSEAGEPVALRE